MLTVDGERINRIYVQLNPDKLVRIATAVMQR